MTITLSNAQNSVSSYFLRNLDRGLEALVSCALESGGYVSQGIQELLQFRRYMNVVSITFFHDIEWLDLEFLWLLYGT